jgi:glycyl-tRNA synthetase beta chain
VSEFPELQGIMGRYYAQHDGINDDIAYAIEDHYKPRFSGDELPRNMVGICVALADKLTTLFDMFGIGEIPTGDKDPFALRRHALGVIRILIERDLPLELNWLFHAARLADARTITVLSDFIYERFRYRSTIESFDEQAIDSFKHGSSKFYTAPATDRIYSPQQMDAVLISRPQLLNDAVKRLAAVRAFAALPEAAALAAANKRVGNILKKAEGNLPLRQAWDERLEIDTGLLQEPAEQALHQILSQIAPKAEAAFAAGDYTASLQALAALKEPVDTFFDKVMVNTEDDKLRANRLALLLQLQQAMNRVADISKLAT